MNIRKDLIQKELENDVNDGLVYKPLKLTNKFIDILFNHYYCHEMTEHFYDREPDYDDAEFDKYMTYCSMLEGHYFNYCENKKEYPVEELKQAYFNILKQREEFEPKRIGLLSWVEPYFKGNWGMSQETVDNVARETLKKEIKKVPLKDRLYYAEKDDQIRIYFYGRDLRHCCDYWFIFIKRKRRK